MPADGPIYSLQQNLVSLSGDAWIEDSDGNRAFEVDGKAFHLRRTVLLNDPQGNELFHISKALMHVRRTYEIKRGDAIVATIQGALVNFLGDSFSVEFADGDELKVKGDIIDREFRISRGDDEVIHVSRHLISLHDTYGAQIAKTFDPALAMAIVVTLEEMESEERNEKAAAFRNDL